VSLLALKSVGFLVFLMPLALFLALLWLFGRLNQDYESLVLQASGAGPLQFYRAIALPVLLVALLVALLSAWLVPVSAEQGYRLRASAEQSLDADALVPGRFHRLRDGRWLLLALRHGPRPGVLEQVFIHARAEQGTQVLVARQAHFEQAQGRARYLVLSDGYRYEGVPGQADFRVLSYAEYALRLQPGAESAVEKWDAVATGQLWNRPGAEAAAELHMRFSRPLSVLVLALLAIPMGRFRPGMSRYFPLWLGVVVFAFYFNLLNVGQLWIERDRLPAWLGLWWVHALVVGAFGALAGVSRWRKRRSAGA
jgi:lipopolysaccharide export system permease protein